MLGKSETDTDASDIAQALADLPDTVSEITVHINSYGGEVAEGVAIYNALRSHRARVTTVCEGFACSIASVIFMAGERRVMRPASLLMLHNASMQAHGDANAHRKAADALDTITELSRTAYLARATDALTPEMLAEVMDRETWVTPETALEWGLATEVEDQVDADGPTQSAARLVFGALTETDRDSGACVHIPVEDATNRLFDKLFDAYIERNPDVLAQYAPMVPEVDSQPNPEPPVETANERHARIFRQLAETFDN